MFARDGRGGGPQHLFLSYAWEDGALCEWLALKLTAEGYMVWCDRLKILGGENWPEDIDRAIKNDTIRMLQLVSKYSLTKPNPRRERELALRLQDRRKTEFYIPLNIDGTEDLPWRIADIAYIPFQNWSTGFAQLLKKLEAAGIPRPLAASGAKLAAQAWMVPEVVLETNEELASNLFQFSDVPQTLMRFRFGDDTTGSQIHELRGVWPFRRVGRLEAIAFAPPPAEFSSIELYETQQISWKGADPLDGVPTDHTVLELLRKSIEVCCRRRGLVAEPTTRGAYFPFGLVPHNKIKFVGYAGKPTSVMVCGFRTFGGSKYRYHLSPIFRVRREASGEFAAHIRVRVHVTDEKGRELSKRGAAARRKRIGSSWWNGQWLNRQLAVMDFLSEGASTVPLYGEGAQQVSLCSSPYVSTSPRAINEQLLESLKVPAGITWESEEPVMEED